MDRVIKWSPEAAEDLASIAEFIDRDSAFYARAVVSKIFAASENISNFPFSGRIVPEIGDTNIREKLVYSYRVVYRVEEARIIILAVIHGKRVIDNPTEKFTG